MAQGDKPKPVRKSEPVLPVSSTTAARAIENSQHHDLRELTGELIQAGVSQAEARKLASLALKNGHGTDYIGQALGYIDRQRSVHNREGLLIHLVKTNWQPPPVLTGSRTDRRGGEPGQAEKPLPSLSSLQPELLPKLIEIEKRNLAEAPSEFEREIARSRLNQFQAQSDRLGQAGAG